MMIEKKSKKAEMTSKEIVGWVVLAFSFVVILIFIFLINWKGEINQDTCHESVILRASANVGSAEFLKNSIPFRCKSEKTCFTSSSFSKGCDSLGTDYTKVKITSKEEFLSDLADEAYSWHTTLGEGKVNFFTKEFTEQNYCIITSIISLDADSKKLIESQGGVSYYDYYKELEKKQSPKGTSYFREMYGTGSVDEVIKAMLQNSEVKKIGLNLDPNAKINLDQDYTFVSMINTYSQWKAYTGGVGIFLAVVAVTIGTGGTALPVIIGAGVAGTGAGTFGFFQIKDSSSQGFTYMPPRLMSYDIGTLSSLKCTSFDNLV